MPEESLPPDSATPAVPENPAPDAAASQTPEQKRLERIEKFLFNHVFAE